MKEDKVAIAFLNEAEIESILREDLDAEIKKLKSDNAHLRILIGSIRDTYREEECTCKAQPGGLLCSRCWCMDVIDKGLAGIAKERGNGE